MDVVDVKGKRLGFINDLLINFNDSRVVGFSITHSSLLKKNANVVVEDIISFNSVMVIVKIIKGKFLQFKEIKGMSIRDRKGNIMGMVEDLLFDELRFSISAAIVSTGFITNFISGKKIILLKDLILGENDILYNGKNENLNFVSMPHKISVEDDFNEKSEKKDSI